MFAVVVHASDEQLEDAGLFSWPSPYSIHTPENASGLWESPGIGCAGSLAS